ncbi:MAG TPA: hypothetical protein VMW83_04450 [Spirochaetia bacterium]|nr:hypothetical protein [Spirochaetia bacterium]
MRAVGSRRPVSRVLGAVAIVAVTAGLIFLLVRQPWLDITPPELAAAGLEPGYVYNGGPVVTLELKNYTSLPRALVLVNHEPRASFGRRYVTVPVADRDLIEVDGSFYHHSLEVEVLDVSRGITSPPAGRTVEVDGTITAVGRVHVKQP